MAYPVMPLGFLGSQGDEDSYRIERSLRFNSADSAYLERTPSVASNKKLFTLSLWLKPTANYSADRTIFSGRTSGSAGTGIRLTNPNGALEFYRYNGTTYNFRVITIQFFRDPSAWHHFVFVYDSDQATASDRIKVYVNGVQITSFSTSSYPSLGYETQINDIVAQRIGADYALTSSQFYAGYLTEINFIDGQALTPSSFGETDAITGRWKAKAYSGTYGTNGFYLSFKDNASTTTLGYDDAGSNDWTLNNFSVAAGADNDSLVDSPTNYGMDTGLGGEVRGNYATLNPLTGTSTLVDGNLRPSTTGVGLSTVGMSSGKWYCEMTVVTVGTQSDIGIHTGTGFSTHTGSTASGYSYMSSGNKFNNGSASAYGATYTSGDIIGCAFDADNGELSFYKNGVSQGVAFTGLTSVPYFFSIYGRSAATANNVYINFGQRPFAYTAPSGFKALCTTNLTQPTIQKPSSAMDVVTYTGNGSARSIAGLGFSPDLVWIKGRSGATDHAIYDSVRGVQLDLASNLTTDETTQTQGLTAFNSDGFSIGTLAKINTNAATYVAWAWDESATNGVDIVSYTGNGANRTISHNLGVAPKMIIIKARTTAGADQGWPVYHASLANTQYLMLNTAAIAATGADYWNSTRPTASVFSLGTNAAVNANNDTYIAYCFAEVNGFSKFGIWAGDGNADGPFLFCGFRPKFVMYKRSSVSTAEWAIFDSSRNVFNVLNSPLVPSTAAAESTLAYFDFVSNGFKLRSGVSGVNRAGDDHIFAAFAESPFKYARAR